MRKITSLVAALLLSVATFAQAPQGFSYQAVVRDAQNAIVASQTVDVTLTITAEIDGEAVQTYAEKHSVTTNANGLFTLVVGQGESKQKLSDIKWNMPNAIYNMRTETAYGTATTQLLSVPFALYAEQAGELDYQKLAKTLTSDEVQSLLGYVKANELADYAKKSDIPAAADLSGFAKTDTLGSYALNSTLADYAKTTDVANGYVTKETFENYVLSGGDAESVDLTVYAKTADVEAAYAKTADVEATYAKKTDIPAAVNYDNFVTKRYLADSANFITEHQSLAGYARIADIDSTFARKSDIPAAADLSAYAKTADVAAGYVTKETFDNYVLSGGQADSVDLTVYAKTADVEATYAKKTDIPAAVNYNNFVTKRYLADSVNFITEHQSLAGYARIADIDSTFARKSDIPAAADLSAYAKTADVAAGYVTKETFDNYVLSGGQADSVDLTVYAKTADVNAALSLSNHYNDSVFARKSDIPATPDLSGFVKSDTLSIYALNSSLNNYATLRFVNDTLNYFRSAYAKKSEIPTIPTVPTKVSDLENDANYLTEHQDISGKQDVIDDIETIRIGASLGATALQSHQSLAAYSTTAKMNDTLAAYVTTAKLNDTLAVYTKAADVEAAYATKTEVAGIQNAISDIETIRSGAALGATALQEHQSLADYATTAKLNDTLAEYATTAKLNDTLDAYATLSQLQQQIAALQTTMAQLTKNANQIGDMPLANVTVKVVYANDYSGSTDIATVSFLGKTLKSGETTFKVPAYSPAFLSVALSTFNVSNKYYTYTVKVNGEYFDNLAYEYEVANENVYNSGNVSTFNYNTSFCKSSLSNIKIGSKEKDDTYNNRAFYQDPKYIYVDVVDAIQDIDLNDGRPKHQSGYTDMEYFENRLLIGVTNAQYNDSYGDQYLVQLYNGGDASPRIGVKPRWYRWSDKTWNPTDDYNEWEAAMGLVHMSNYNQSATFIKPIYAKVPNFIYKNTFTTKTVYKVGTESGTGLGRNGLNANMNNQVVGPFNQTNNTIVIEVSSYTVVN